ncbi:DUF6929 family protein [Aridibaculum aurantiacum]|uniref:DUF6929 family protein n=1 Tax=Aridibaculum aurantiacum TaxID=2810307 RepID=UPI001A975BCD|nr:hypothetical protein [Aridibaculum aurantiacum]
MKKLLNYLLMAGVITSTACNDGAIKLLHSATLDFPSGSSLEIHNQQLILIGDDASSILLLDKQYNRIDSLSIDTSHVVRLAKNIKHDYEASAIIPYNGVATLICFGSGSTDKRKSGLLIPLPASGQSVLEVKDLAAVFSAIEKAGIKEINIEGAATINDKLVLVNRANQQQTQNTFIMLPVAAVHDTATLHVQTCNIQLPASELIAGISGLAYLAEKDILIFTASTEETTNAFDDGAIGDSYIGMINNASSALQSGQVNVTTWHQLPAVSPQFDGQKIESIAIESVKGDKVIAHLVADNDKGNSVLFRIAIDL